MGTFRPDNKFAASQGRAKRLKELRKETQQAIKKAIASFGGTAVGGVAPFKPTAEFERIVAVAVKRGKSPEQAVAIAAEATKRPGQGVVPLGVYEVKRPTTKQRPKVYEHDFQQGKDAKLSAIMEHAKRRQQEAMQGRFAPKSAPGSGGYDIGETPQARIEILGPFPLQHEGRLRNTGKATSPRKGQTAYSARRQTMKKCGHWAMYSWAVRIEKLWYLGITFKSGYRCYYPQTASDYQDAEPIKAIRNAESGSYYVWDNLMGQPYIAF